jgi:uncharacterized BrkB/YihY/UPF0761 family membrane protein
LAVRQKYADDQGGFLAATLTCYAFFAVFPLRLLLVTGLGFALSGDASLQRRVLHSVLAQFPIIGPQLQRNVHSLRGSGVALAIGLGGSLWAGMGVVLAAQNAMNHLWDVRFAIGPTRSSRDCVPSCCCWCLGLPACSPRGLPASRVVLHLWVFARAGSCCRCW